LPGPVLVVDEIDDEPVYAVVERLAGLGVAVLLMTRRTQFGGKLAYVSQLGVYRRLDGIPVTLLTGTEPMRCDGDVLTGRNVFSGREHVVGRVGSVVRAGPYQPATPIDTAGRTTLVIGDAYTPRPLSAIVHDAARIAATLPDAGSAG
jgi:hypothetical protein